MRTPRRRERPVTADDLYFADLFDLEVGVSEEYLPPGRLDELRRMWQQVRPDFMPDEKHPFGGHAAGKWHSPAGTRAWAWWRFEQNEPKPRTPTEQRERLRELGVLASWEWAACEAHLRHQARQRLQFITSPHARAELVLDEAKQLGVTATQILAWLDEDAGDLLQRKHLVSRLVEELARRRQRRWRLTTFRFRHSWREPSL